MILTRWNRPSMLGVAILYIVFGSLWSWGWAADVPVKIGIIMPYSLKVKRAVEVRAILPAVQLAMDEINNSSTLLPGIQLQAVTRDSWTVQYENTSLVDSAAQALAATTELITDEAVIAVIGDLQSPTTEYEGLLTSYHKIPQFGPATSSPTLSNRDRYPYLYRMTHDQEQPAIFLVDYIKQMGWKRVAVLKTTDAFGTAVAEAVLARCAHNSVTVILNQGFYQTGERDSITLNLALTNLANVGAQIVIVCANPYNTADIYYAAYDAGLVGREYVWLGASGIGEEGDDLIAEYGPDAIPKSQGFIAAWPEGGQESPTGKAWLAKWDDLNKNDSYRYPMIGDGTYYTSRASYDIVWTLAYGFQTLLNRGGTPAQLAARQPNPGMTLDLFNYTGFKGALGEIKLDADGGLIKQFNVYAQLGDDYDDEDGNGLLASVDIEGEFKFVGRPFLNFDGSDYVPPDKSLYPICNRGEEARLRYDEYVCIPCAEGTYNMDHNSTCKLCPQGGVCRDGINVLTRQNYWKNPAASSLNKAFYTCGVGGSCCQSPTGCTWDNQCQNNMEGPLCGSCEPGLYSWNGQCVSCDVYSPGPLLALLLAYGAVVVALFVLPKNASGFFEDLVNFYQIAGFVFIQQSTTADSVIDFMELRFEVRMHSHPCVAPFSPIQKEVRGLFTPLIMLAWFGVLALAAITSRRLLGSTVAVKYWHKIQDLPLQQNLYATLYCIGLFCYGPLLETCIGFMDCVRVENFGWFMRVNPGVQCWADGQHISVAVFAIISCIVLMIPGPLILLRRLRHLRRTDRMSYPASMLHLVQMPLRPKAGVVPKAVSNEDVAFADQMLYSEFKPSLWFWLPLDVIMRALIYLLATLLGGIPNGRTLSVLFTAYVYLLIFIFVQPAATLVDNAVRIVTYISLVALSSFALAESLHLQDPNNITALSQGVPGAFLAIPIVLVPLKLPWRKMLKLRGEPKEGVAEAVDIIVKSFDSIAAEFHSRRGSKVSMHRGTSRTGDSGHTAGPEMSLMATADRPRKSSTLYPPGFEPVDNEEFA